jgi:hypothetical protein
VPRPLEDIPEGDQFKTITIKVSAPDWQRIRDRLEEQEAERGYPVALQSFFEEMIGKEFSK